MRLTPVLLILWFQITWGQLDIGLSPAAMMPQITTLDVQCEKTGMTVFIEFDRPYNGIIFSKGHYSTATCRYVQANSGQMSYTFKIPKEGCGTTSFPDPNDPRASLSYENIIIFQMDPDFQEVWDMARRISCQWTNIFQKRIIFQPFVVDMLDVISVPFQGDKINCWMDVQQGTFPQSRPIDGLTKIGEELTIVIYVQDENKNFDISVKDCYAFDSPNYNKSDTKRLQLTDFDGCPLRPKLIDYWKRTLQTGDTGASIIAFNSLKAFKFPDGMDVYITCNIEICQEECTDRCPGEPTNPVIVTVPPTLPPITQPPITRPPITRPPITRPPITRPPITRPPVTRPPITRPPITRPPITRPPITRPPVTRPPITKPPITRPPITRPPITRPPITRPPITRPPITRPPITRPPITRPPITRPPITRPPITRPPVTRPPITRPPITRPPITRPPVTRPPITRPPITRPPITRPPITRPPITRPPITRPPITRPPITRPPITRPPVTRPPITRPPITRPPITRPPITRPPITRPPITRPPVTRPPITRPPVTRPPITRPPITRPPITRPPITRPPVTQPPTKKPKWSGNAPPDHPFHSFHYQPVRPRRFGRSVWEIERRNIKSTLQENNRLPIFLRSSFRVGDESVPLNSIKRSQKQYIYRLFKKYIPN